MKKQLLRVGLLALFTSLGISCSNDNNELKEQYKIVSANSAEKASIAQWMSLSSGEILQEKFNADEVQKIIDLKNGFQILTILSTHNKAEALSFSLDPNGQVTHSFLSKTTKRENGEIVNDISAIDGKIKFSYIDRMDGTREVVTYENLTIAGRSAGWWSDADECVGMFHNLTGSNIGNIAVTTVFNAATLGLYTPLSLVLCAGYATVNL